MASVYEPGAVVRGTPYAVTRLLGRGGMGAVYEVEHTLLGRKFVLKLLHAALAAKDDVVARMQNEWRTLGRLQHPNIVQVTDAGTTSDGLPYYVMERLEGEVLDAVLVRRRRLDPVEAVQITLDVLSGLAAAHEEHAIHRDIKPQNVFVTARGAKILDFGIAKLRDQALRVVTKAGVALGTPRYMAPEQAEGKVVDARTDLYALGLVLFEMLVGRGPFSHLKDASELVLAQIGQDPPRVDVLVPSIPEELGDFTQRLLAKLPDSRPRSAALAERELRALLDALQNQAIRTEITAVGPDPNERTLGAAATTESTAPGPGPDASAEPGSAPRTEGAESLAPTESLAANEQVGPRALERLAVRSSAHSNRRRALPLPLLAALSVVAGGVGAWVLVPTPGAALPDVDVAEVPRATESQPADLAAVAEAGRPPGVQPSPTQPASAPPTPAEAPSSGSTEDAASVPPPKPAADGRTASVHPSPARAASGGPATSVASGVGAKPPPTTSSPTSAGGARSTSAQKPQNSSASTQRTAASGLPPSGLW